MLNDHRFDNRPHLRNKYIHGSNKLDVHQHEHGYYKLVKLLVLTVLKINEEFCRGDYAWDIKE